MDYVLVFAFIVTSALLYKRYIDRNETITALVLLAFIILFCACRKPVFAANSDALAYQQFYQNLAHEPLTKSQLNELLFYGAFRVLSRMHIPYSGAKCVYYTLMFCMVIKLQRIVDLKKCRYYEFLFLFSTFVLANTLMRNCFAYIMGWQAIAFAQKKQYGKALLLATLGTLIHNTCLIVVVYIIFEALLSKLYSYYMLCFAAIMYYISIHLCFPILVDVMGQRNGKMNYYISVQTGGSVALFTTLMRVSLLLLIIFHYCVQRRFKKDNEYKSLLILILFSLSLITMQLTNGIFYRFLPYFDIEYLLSFSYFRKNPQDRTIAIPGYKLINLIIMAICFSKLAQFVVRDIPGYGLIPIVW